VNFALDVFGDDVFLAIAEGAIKVRDGYRMPISSPHRATEVFRAEFDAAREFGALWISVWHPALSRRLARFKAVLELRDYMRTKHMQKLMAEGRWTPRYETVPAYQSPLPEFSKDR
jgi:hypothetical protein